MYTYKLYFCIQDAQLHRDTQIKCEKGTVDLQDSQKYWFIKVRK